MTVTKHSYFKDASSVCCFNLKAIFITLCLILFVHLNEAATVDLNIAHTGYLLGDVFPTSTSVNCYFEDSDSAACTNGCHRRTRAINKLRTDYSDLVVVDGGGYFWGSVFFTLYNNTAAVECFNSINYDVTALGGSDLYAGSNLMYDFMHKTVAPIKSTVMISTNLDVSGSVGTDQDWTEYISPYYLKTLKDSDNNDVKVGFISFLAEYFEVTTSKLPEWFKIAPKFSSFNYLRKTISELRADGVSIIVLLVEENRGLTNIDELKELEFVNVVLIQRYRDILISPTPGAQPTNKNTFGYYENIYGKNVLVSGVQSDVASVFHIQATFDLTTQQATFKPASIAGKTSLALTLSAANYPIIGSGDTAATNLWNNMNDIFNPGKDDEFQRTLTIAEVYIDGRESEGTDDKKSPGFGFSRETWGCRAGACPMGELVIESMLKSCKDYYESGDSDKPCDIALTNAGGIRSSFNSGEVTVEEVYTTLPFFNSIVSFDITGAVLMEVLANSISQGTNGRFLQSNFRFVYKPRMIKTNEVNTEHVMDVFIKNSRGVWEEAQNHKTYRLVTNAFIHEGRDGYTMLPSIKENFRDHGETLAVAFIKYLEAQKSVTAMSYDQARDCIFDTVDTVDPCPQENCWKLPPFEESSQCLNLFTTKTSSEYNSCPSNQPFCSTHQNSTFYSTESCDECSGFGTCINRKCTCTFSVGTIDEVIDGTPTYGPFSGIQMLRGHDCSQLREQWTFSGGERSSLYIAGALSILVSAVWMILLFVFRAKPVIKATSPIFSMIMCGGAIIGSLSIFMDAQDSTTHLCNASIWLLLIGYSILFSCVFVKTHRIHQIFNSKLLKNKTKYTDAYVLLYVSLIVLAEFIILITFRAVDPLEASASELSGGFKYAILCASDSIIFTGVLFAFNGLLMCWGVYLAIRTRNVDSNFNESRYIGIAIYNCAFSCLIVVLVMYVVIQTEPTIAFIIKNWIIAYIIIASLTIIFLPRFRLLYLGIERASDTSNRSATAETDKQMQRDKRTIQTLVQNMKQRDMQVAERDEALKLLKTTLESNCIAVPAYKITSLDNSISNTNASNTNNNNDGLTASGATKKPLFANRITLPRQSDTRAYPSSPSATRSPQTSFSGPLTPASSEIKLSETLLHNNSSLSPSSSISAFPSTSSLPSLPALPALPQLPSLGEEQELGKM